MQFSQFQWSKIFTGQEWKKMLNHIDRLKKVIILDFFSYNQLDKN